MANRSRQTFQKHQKEHARRQKQQRKAARRLEAKQRRADGASERDASPVELADRRPDPPPAPARGDRARERT